MQVEMHNAIVHVMERGNGASVLIPLAGGGALRVSYLWGKLGVVFCDLDGKIQLPAKRGGGSRISATKTTTVGEGAAKPTPPVQLTLGDEFLPLGGGSDVDPD